MLGDLARQRRVDAGHGLVEQDQPGPGHQRAADLDQLLLSARERRDGIVDHGFDLEAADDRQRFLGGRLLGLAAGAGPGQGGPEAFAEIVLGVEHQVLEDGQPGKAARQLEGAHQAEADALPGGHAGDVVAGELDRARIGNEEAGNSVVERRLAGAVGADQAGELAFLDAEVDAVEHRRAVEGVAQVADLEQAHAVGSRLCASARTWFLSRIFHSASIWSK